MRDKYGVTWWDNWDIGDRTIGFCHGETVRHHNLVDEMLRNIEKDPSGHIINMWQAEDYKHPHSLKSCCCQTAWNVRHGKDGVDYLDMCLLQRSSDFATAGCINQFQYVVLQYLFARHLGYKPGKFSWMANNVQIYDRHIDQVKEMLDRNSIKCSPKIWLNPDKKDFYSFTKDDIKIVGYPFKEIKEKNPQLIFPIGI